MRLSKLLKQTFPLGTYCGVPVYIHWSLALMFVLLLPSPFAFLQVATIFGIVTLHEYGHILAARDYGVKTHSILLLPIGGLAQLEKIPPEPTQELWVAIAGPLINVALAFPLYFLQYYDDFFIRVAQINFYIMTFNLLPAFPMDGGRIVRSILALRFNYVKATGYGVRLAYLVFLGMFIYGIFAGASYALCFVAMLMALGATAEYETLKSHDKLRDLAQKVTGNTYPEPQYFDESLASRAKQDIQDRLIQDRQAVIDKCAAITGKTYPAAADVDEDDLEEILREMSKAIVEECQRKGYTGNPEWMYALGSASILASKRE